ncbi:MAG: efflux RND transporter periplasmic adaptor subunit [Sphingomonas bacterium]|nr:efflux RND transporter periplasmic adaptor subunit [Sphingomonas bacterium]
MNRETMMHRSDTLVVVDRSARRRNLIIAAVAAVVILIAAFVMFGMGKDDGANQQAAAAGPGGKPGGQIPSVTVVVPGRTEVARVVTASGSLAARRDEPVGVAGEGGRVSRVYVDAGSWVRQGQVLASLDRSVQSQEAAQLAAQIQVARADAALAQNELERSQALVGRGFVSKADLDRKRAARDAASARVRVAQASLGASQARIGRLDVRAPSSGLILSRSVEVGQIVSAGAGGLFRLARGGEMEMRASLSQQDMVSVRTGMAASVTPIGLGRSFAGTIWQVSPVIDPTSRQGEVRISIPYDPSIRPGGFAEAKIASGSTTAPLLPQSAVLSDEKGSYVFVVNRENKVERRAIKVGAIDNEGVTVVEGLTGQEAIVVSAGAFLNPGQKVAPRRQAAR